MPRILPLGTAGWSLIPSLLHIDKIGECPVRRRGYLHDSVKIGHARVMLGVKGILPRRIVFVDFGL